MIMIRTESQNKRSRSSSVMSGAKYTKKCSQPKYPKTFSKTWAISLIAVIVRSNKVIPIVIPKAVAIRSKERKGLWFADTCACSWYLLKKTLLIFPKAK